MNAPAPHLTRVVLAFVPERVNNRLRFGHPVHEMTLDRWRTIAQFAPESMSSRLLYA